MTVDILGRYARQARQYSAAILSALSELKRGDYAAARATLEAAERDMRREDAMALKAEWRSRNEP